MLLHNGIKTKLLVIYIFTNICNNPFVCMHCVMHHLVLYLTPNMYVLFSFLFTTN